MELLNADGDIDGEAMPAHRAIATLFARDLPALQDAIGTMQMPVRQNFVTLQEAGAVEAIRVGVQSKWAIYRARTEAWLVNGSYNFTGGDFKGSIATPSIDTLGSHPGPGWEPIVAEEISAGNTIKFYRFKNDIAALLAGMASSEIAIPT